MQEVLSKSQKLYNRLHQLHYVINQVIRHNEGCFVDFKVYQNESYKLRRHRCFAILKANEYLEEIEEKIGKVSLLIS